MNLLVVHEVNYLSKIIYEFQILPEILSLQGHQVTIVDFDDSWQQSPASQRIRFRTDVRTDVHRAYPSASVTLRRPGMVQFPVVSRISGALLTGLELMRMFRNSQFDAVLLYGLPTVGIQTLIAARMAGVPVLFRSIDILHRLVPNRALVPITRALEKVVYNSVPAISCVTPRLRQHVLSYGVPEDRVTVIPSGVDADMFSPGPGSKAFRATWRIGSSDPVALFMGTIYTFSGLDRVIRDWPALLDRHPGARLLIVGVGADEERLRRLATETGLGDHVIFTGLQPYDKLPEIIRSVDVCINPFELNDITRDILPTKLFQYLACGKPVLATELPGTKPFLSGEEQGVVYTSLDEFTESLGDLFEDRDRSVRIGADGERSVREKYDWRRIAEDTVAWIGAHLRR